MDGTALPAARHAFRAMGTQVCLVADHRSDARTFERVARSVELTFVREERRFSRFRPESELARVNARAGRWTPVTSRFAEVVRLAIRAAEETDGLFDPTILPTLESLGYDRDFDELLAGARAALRPARTCGRWAEIAVRDDRILLPAGVRMDLGGIAKGWTADLAAELAVAGGLRWAIVNAGGDLRLAGLAPAGGVEVGIEDPQVPDGEVGRITIEHGALATSGVTKRAWGPGLHHLVDPRTGSPADGPALQATVWAPTCAEAEVRAKRALLEGRPALTRLDGLLVLADGSVVTNIGTDLRAEVVA